MCQWLFINGCEYKGLISAITPFLTPVMMAPMPHVPDRLCQASNQGDAFHNDRDVSISFYHLLNHND
jgi:hypothetical protein